MLRIFFLLLLVLVPSTVLAQTAEPQTCQNIIMEFADGFSRAPRKNAASIEPVLVIASIQSTDQTVTYRVRPISGDEITKTVSVPAKKRVTIDLYSLLNRTDVDFSLEVEFQGFGVADLKMWSGGHGTVSLGETFCR